MGTTKPAAQRVAALDGVRGAGVIVVVGYHLGATWLEGGWFLLNTFFVLSGYLITSNLLAAPGELSSIGRFWWRRVRRLIPALCVVVGAVVATASLFLDPARIEALRSDAASALAFVANWRFVSVRSVYDAPAALSSPLLHLWTLAIEEQFYLVWPLVVAACVRWSHRPRRAVGAAAAGITAASAAAMVWLYQPDDVWSVYFSTLTRAHGLTIGALAAVVSAGPARSERGAWGRRVAAWPALAVLAAVTVSWGLTDPAVYRGGMVAAEVAVAVLVVGLVSGAAPAQLLAAPPIASIGRMSYAIYLWHWPVIVALTEATTGLDGAALLSVRVASIALLSSVTHVVVERPFMASLPNRAAAPAIAVLWGVAAALAFALPAAAPDPAPPDEAAEGLAPVAVDGLHRVIVVGDSLAISAEGGFEEMAGPGFAVTHLSSAGCGWSSFTATADTPLPDPQRCVELRERRARDAARADWVVAVSASELLDRDVDGARAPLGTPAGDRAALEEFDAAHEQLTAAGARLVVALMAPPGRESVAPMLVDNDLERIGRLNELLIAFAGEHPDVVVVDPTEALCPGGCRSAAATPLRDNDGRHLTAEGARVFAHQVLSAIAAAS